MLDTIVLALACLTAPLFALHAGYEIKKKPFDMVGVGGLFFLVAAAFMVGFTTDALKDIGKLGVQISYLLGWFCLAVGAVFGAYNVLVENDRTRVPRKV